MPATSEPAPGSVTPTAVMVLPAMTPGRYCLELALGAEADQMRARHVGVHQHGDGEAAMGRAADLLGQHDRGARIEAGAAQRSGKRSEEAELAHLAQHLARHEARPPPRLALRLHLLVDEAAELVAQHLMLGGEIDRVGSDVGNGHWLCASLRRCAPSFASAAAIVNRR